MTHEDYIARLIEKANESLDAAQSLLDGDHHAFAASRTYYAMFYAAEAAPSEEGAFLLEAHCRHGRVQSRVREGRGLRA
jgi:hypothetical protein